MISPLAHVDPEAKLGKNVTIHPFSFISKNVEIGDKVYQRHEQGSSVLYDMIDGEWIIHEMSDSAPQITGRP